MAGLKFARHHSNGGPENQKKVNFLNNMYCFPKKTQKNDECWFNPILHTWISDSCFTCDGFSTIRVFLFFLISTAI
jgi:hypothetical protein